MKTLRTWLDDYLEHRNGLNYSERSLEEYRYDCGTFLTYLEGRLRVRTAPELRKSSLEAYQGHLGSKRNAKGLPLRPRTVNKNISGVRNFLDFLVERGVIPRSLPKALKTVREPSFLPLGGIDHVRIRRTLAKIDASTLAGQRDGAILEVLYSTGIRASELCGIDEGDVDLRNNLLRVLGKGRKERTVPVGKTASRRLETYLRAVRPFLRRAGSGKAVFLKESGARIDRHYLRRIVKKRFGDDATTHAFRRSCATELIRSNANLYHVKELLGHETLGTVKHYAKLTIADLKKTHAKCHPREKDD